MYMCAYVYVCVRIYIFLYICKYSNYKMCILSCTVWFNFNVKV